MIITRIQYVPYRSSISELFHIASCTVNANICIFGSLEHSRVTWIYTRKTALIIFFTNIPSWRFCINCARPLATIGHTKDNFALLLLAEWSQKNILSFVYVFCLLKGFFYEVIPLELTSNWTVWKEQKFKTQKYLVYKNK